MLISIVIPAYNSEKYILKCLESLEKSYIPSAEIIIVNDGSLDNTESIVKSFIEKSNMSNISLISTSNRGVSSARNTGISIARGEYIGFVDSDDYVSDNYFSILNGILQNKNLDLVEFGANLISNGDVTDKVMPSRNRGLSNVKSWIDDIFCESVFYSPLRIVKKNLISGIGFPEGVKFCEDLIFWSKVYKVADIFYTCEEYLYNYRVNFQGATQNLSSDYYSDVLRYYKSIGFSGYYDVLLKANLLYVIYRIRTSSNIFFVYERSLLFCSFFVFCKVIFYPKFPLRKKIIIAMPNIHYLLRKIFLRVS